MIETVTYISPEGEMIEVKDENITTIPSTPYKEPAAIPTWPMHYRVQDWLTLGVETARSRW